MVFLECAVWPQMAAGGVTSANLLPDHKVFYVIRSQLA